MYATREVGVKIVDQLTLGWREYSDYPSKTNIIRRVLKSGRGRLRRAREEDMMTEMGSKCCDVRGIDFEDGRKNHQPRCTSNL
jgi:hypothetical protein